MTNWYQFYEPGVIPGIPGQFAGCRVEVLDDGTLRVSPLSQHPHFTPAIETDEEQPVGEEN